VSAAATRTALWRRGERLWQTVRHVPPGQLLRRAELLARYRLMDLVPSRAAPAPPPALAPVLPPPLFPPRADRLRVVPGGFRLRLPWGERTFVLPVAWTPAAGGATSRADTNNLHFMEFLPSADDALFTALIDDWIARNPQEARGAWRFAWRPYNLSLRVVVWMEELARRRDRLDPAFLGRAQASLARQLRFLEHHLETDLRGNHLIKNIRALLWGGAFFVGPEAERWSALGRRLLRRELAEQVLPDGCHYERSPAYQCQVLEDLLACRAALPAPVPELDAALGRMAHALALLTHPDGRVAQFNDGGLSMAPPPALLLATWARLTGGAPASARGPFALPDGGYFGLKGEDELLVVDCGELGPSYLPGHGHCDLLACEWSTGGRRILVDQGTYQYFADPRRLASRSTRSHNTVSLDGAEQSDIYGAFRCGRRARPELRAFERRGDGFRFVGSHDGFTRLPGRPRHVRTIEAAPGRLVIRDRIEGGGSHDARSRLLLHPGCTVEVEGSGALIRSGPVAVRLEASAPIAAEPAEWYPDIYVAEPTLRLVLPVAAGGQGLELRLERVDAARAHPASGAATMPDPALAAEESR
jgi:hypothetical protein